MSVCRLTLVIYFQVVDGVCLPYTFWPSSLFKSTFGVILVLIEYLFPFMILVYCYGRILWILSKRIDSNFGISVNQDQFLLARQNTLKTFLLVGLCYIICWSSVQIYYLMFNLGYDADFNGTFYKVALLTAFGNCTINPFIYLFKYRDYQEALKSCICCKLMKGGDESENKGSDISMSGVTVATIG